MFGLHGIACFFAQFLVNFRNTKRLIHCHLLLQSQMQRHMQKRIGFALFRQPVMVFPLFQIFNNMLIFWVCVNNFNHSLLQCVLRNVPHCPSISKKLSRIVGVDIKHFHSYKINFFRQPENLNLSTFFVHKPLGLMCLRLCLRFRRPQECRVISG